MNLKEYLTKNDISVASFAEAVGISHCSIYNYINKRRKPSRWIAKRIEEACGGEVKASQLRSIVPVKYNKGKVCDE